MRFLSTTLLVLIFGLLGACGDEASEPSPPTEPASPWTHEVVAGGTAYYLTGPQQGRPPEGRFEAGTKVKIVSEHGSYVRVESETGVTAHVATGSIRQIAP